MNNDDLERLLINLREAIEQERAALAARDFEALKNAIATKSELVMQVEQGRKQVAENGIHLDPATTTLLNECVLQNRVNGGAIALCREMIDSLFDTLNGSTRSPRLYDAGGNVQQTGGGRRVGYA